MDEAGLEAQSKKPGILLLVAAALAALLASKPGPGPGPLPRAILTPSTAPGQPEIS